MERPSVNRAEQLRRRLDGVGVLAPLGARLVLVPRRNRRHHLDAQVLVLVDDLGNRRVQLIGQLADPLRSVWEIRSMTVKQSGSGA